MLQIARRNWRPTSPLTLLELVQEGNAVLVQTIERFQGGPAEEFQRELAWEVEQRLRVLTEGTSPPKQ